MQATKGMDTEALRQLLSTAGPVVSVYFGLTAPSGVDAWLRWQSLADRLTEEGADPDTIKTLTRRVSTALPGIGVFAGFAANGELLFDAHMPGSAQDDLGVLSPLPHLLPLVAWAQERPARVLAVVDRTGADLTAYPNGTTKAVTRTITGTDDEIERNAPGGWSQMRYQHRAEDSWEHNAVRVAEGVSRMLADLHGRLLLLAGDVRALQYLTRHLPAWVRRDVVIRRVCGSRSADGSWEERAAQVDAETRRAAEEETRMLLRRLAEERSPSGGATEGVRETLDALAHGRVRMLFVVDDPRDERTAWFGPAPTDVSDRRSVLARRTTAPLARAPLADVAVRAAILTAAEVRVLHPDTPGGPVQGIGALCRFPPTP